jgi:hypothetical protein
MGRAKNKVKKRGVFFAAEKVLSKSPHLPRKPPQIDHKLPSKNTPKTQKDPIKTPLHHAKLFPVKTHSKIPTTSG